MDCGYCGEQCDGDSGVFLGAGEFVPLHHNFNPVILAPNGQPISGHTGRPVPDERLRDSCYVLVTVDNRPLLDGRRANPYYKVNSSQRPIFDVYLSRAVGE